MRSDKPRLQNLIKKQNQLLKVKETFLRCETFIATQMQEWQNKKNTRKFTKYNQISQQNTRILYETWQEK